VAERSIVVRLKAEVSDYKRQMAEAARETDKIPESAARAETALGRMVQSARYNREAWDRAGRTLTVFGTATVAALGASAKAAIDWESAWTGVLKTVDGTDSQLAELEDDLRQMARTLPATHQEIAAVAEAAGQLGIQTPNVAAFTRTMIDLGETTNLSAQDAATGLARFANVMGTSQDDFDRLGSVIVGLGNNFATTEAEILAMAQRLSSAGRVVGLTEADVLALATAMSSVGIEAEAGGSAISRVMIKIGGAVDEGGADLEEFARAAGMSSQAFAEKWRTAPVDALLAVVGGLARMTETGQGTFSMLDELGLRDIRVTNAMLSLSNATELTAGAVAMASDEWDRNNALLTEAEKRYETAAARLSVARNNINDAAISLGEVFLPAIVEASEAVARFAGWLADLPLPVREAAAGLGTVTGATALMGGAFLLAFPRVMDTISAFKQLRADMPRTASALSSVGKAAGVIGTVAAVAVPAFEALGAAIEEAVFGRAADVDQLTESLTNFARTEVVAGEASRLFGEDLSGLDEVLRRTNGFSATAGKATQWFANLSIVGKALPNSWNNAKDALAAYDDVLVRAVQSGDMQTYSALLDEITTRAEAQGISQERVAELLPRSTVAFEDAAVAMEASTGAADRWVSQMEGVAGAEAAATEALQEWRDMVGAADAAFVDLADAYQGAIDANIAYAQSAADATEDATDSWEDYYDGVSVSATDYIAELEAQVAAQEAWETNMVAIAERVRSGMTGEMALAGEQMIDELLALGPEGAAQVQLLAEMSDEEFARVVELWGNRGTEAVTEFTRQVESYRQPQIDVTANLTPAESQMRDFVNRQWSARVRFDFSAGSGLTPRVVHLGQMADGGPVPGVAPHPRADNVLVRLTSGEYVHQVPAVNYWGRGFMDAVNRMDKAAVAAQVAGYAYGGQVGVAAPAPVPVVYSPGAPGRSAPLVGQMVVNEVTDGIGTAHTVLRYVESLGV
jgi:TP901 family phage tail tape measure protein